MSYNVESAKSVLFFLKSAICYKNVKRFHVQTLTQPKEQKKKKALHDK